MMIVNLILALILIVSAVAVVVMKNPIHSALALIANLLTVAAFFAVLNAHFLAVAQIIVYAGAIMVLFVFVLMLLNIKEEGRSHGGIFSVTTSILLGAGFVLVLIRDLKLSSFSTVAKGVNGSVSELGMVLFRDFVFSFELASLLIISAVVGAVMIAKRKTTGVKDGSMKLEKI